MNRKTWAVPTKAKEREEMEHGPDQTNYEARQLLLQTRRTETQLTADPAPRCGFSFRGIEELIRGAGSLADQPKPMLLKVQWRRAVTWEKTVRITEF